MNPNDLMTLDEERTELIADALVDRARSGPAAPQTSQRRPLVLVAVIVLVLAGLTAVAVEATRAPAPAVAMFEVTPTGDWIDITRNPDARSFDVEAAASELRDMGFRAETGTARRWQDERGDWNVQAPNFGGEGIASLGIGGRGDRSEVMISIEAPEDYRIPTSDDGTLIDWTVLAEELGMRDPMTWKGDGFELRRDSPVTIYVLAIP